jgi:hypothetical protein
MVTGIEKEFEVNEFQYAITENNEYINKDENESTY